MVQRFLAAARDHDHEGFTVPAAAGAVYVSVSRLHSIVQEALGYPPGMVLDLVRLESVAVAISGSSAPFMNIAETHGYSAPPAMNRQFVRFVGVAPGEYRARTLLRQPRHEA